MRGALLSQGGTPHSPRVVHRGKAGVVAWLLGAWRGPAQVRAQVGRPTPLLVVLRGPEREVVAEQLHDQGGVLVALLVERVELRDGVVEGLVG